MLRSIPTKLIRRLSERAPSASSNQRSLMTLTSLRSSAQPAAVAAAAGCNAAPIIPQQSQLRFYRGDTGDAVPSVSSNEARLFDIAKPKADAIYERHIEMPEGGLENRKKRLIYRSKQRGWLEVDLLLGTWASENVPNLSTQDELDQFEAFVNMETIDIYNVITLRLDVPDGMKREGGDGVVERIQAWARSHPLGKADPDTYRAVKTE
eukprot:CAMPEP_0119560508 /NCGR_PEP_ID=MMETSP1352-20130426/15015_1 /TAXON_ID=265584 /ORGANISM="Stauroneis constricta, Strain CCMP1120" /LENGTH=207 /DNA_ID=CAMNT_0007608495 /DNA_START=31 /DNA_END=651 /DNA_ORIENTATION=-